MRVTVATILRACGLVRLSEHEHIMTVLKQSIDDRCAIEVRLRNQVAELQGKIAGHENFINKELACLTRLQPEVKAPKPNQTMMRWWESPDESVPFANEVLTGRRRDLALCVALPAHLDIRMQQGDYRTVHLAIEYIARSVSYQIERMLRLAVGEGGR